MEGAIKDTPSGKTFEVSFPYDSQLVRRIKCIPGARWYADVRRWRIPVSERPYIESWMAGPTLPPLTPEWYPTTEPWLHQEDALTFTINKPAALLDVGMGAGKSLMALALLTARKAKHTLLICPKAIIPVWSQQIERHTSPGAFQVVLLGTGSVARNRELAEQALESDAPAILVTNYDSVWREPFADWCLSIEWDVVIADEAHRLQSANSSISKFAHKLGFRARQKLGLSGTPFGQDPLHAYGVYRFLDPSIFGTSFVRFRDEFAEVDASRGFPKVVGYKNQDLFRKKIDNIRFHVSREVLDLPPVLHTDIPITLPEECKTTYRRLERDFYVKVGAGEITASNVLVRALRLQQLTSGFATTDAEDFEAKGQNLLLHNAKGEVLLSLLEDIDPSESVVVFARFVHDLRQIAHATSSAGRAYFEMSGKHKEMDRWLTSTGGVLGVQIQTGAEGQNDMVKAHYGIFYSLPYGLTTFDQACGRLHRPGQTAPVTYLHLVMQETIDQRVYRALQERRDVLLALLEE